MATYIVLGQFTDQGIRNVADTSKRADAAKALVKKVGAKVRDLFWTIGRYDVALILEAPDDETMTVFGLSANAMPKRGSNWMPGDSMKPTPPST